MAPSSNGEDPREEYNQYWPNRIADPQDTSLSLSPDYCGVAQARTMDLDLEDSVFGYSKLPSLASSSNNSSPYGGSDVPRDSPEPSKDFQISEMTVGYNNFPPQPPFYGQNNPNSFIWDSHHAEPMAFFEPAYQPYQYPSVLLDDHRNLNLQLPEVNNHKSERTDRVQTYQSDSSQLSQVPCKSQGCTKRFSKKADMERHHFKIHEGGGIVCGDCQNIGVSTQPKRKDHFFTHLNTSHDCEETAWESFKRCPSADCLLENKNQSLLFSSQDALDRHKTLKHKGTISRRLHGRSSTSSESHSQSSKGATLNQDSSSGRIGYSRLANSKRPGDPRQFRAKRTCRGSQIAQTQPVRSSLSSSNRTAALQTIVGDSQQDHMEYPAALELDGKSGQNESYITSVNPNEYLILSQRSGTHLDALMQLNKSKESHSITFDMSQNQIRLCGPPKLVECCRGFVEEDLHTIRSLRVLVPLTNADTNSRTGAQDHLRTDFQPPPVPRRNNNFDESETTFPVRKEQDRELLILWMKDILPALFKILDESIGNEYSASLVRVGINEHSALPRIRIESPQVPQQTTRVDIIERLEKLSGVSLTGLGVQVDFSPGSLVLLAGLVQKEKEPHDSKRILPFYSRHWKYPGMGASIGMLCTEQEFATLGCYVELNNDTFILTVDHFIEKSYGQLVENGSEDKETITSPALAKVHAMKEELGHLLSALNGELRAEMRRQFGDRKDIGLADLQPLPRGLFEICEKMKLVQTFITELEKEKLDFKVGELKHRCKPNARAPLSISNSTVGAEGNVLPPSEGRPELCHRLDWSLFRVDPARFGPSQTGNNRHRYRYDPTDRTTDFLPQDQNILAYGEGDICRDTCIVAGEESVCFVGQTSGRLEGIVNGTLRAINYKGVKTTEHHIIISADQRREDKEHQGDSGAVVLRLKDNKMMGIVWGCFNREPLFTPIRTVFQNISEALQVEHVNLSATGNTGTLSTDGIPTTAEARMTCGTLRDTPRMPPFKSSDVPLPKLTPGEEALNAEIHAASILQNLQNGFLSKNLIPRTNEASLVSGSQRDVPRQRPFKTSDVPLAHLTAEEEQLNGKEHAALLLKNFLGDSGHSGIPAPSTVVDRPPSASPVPSLSSSIAASPKSMPASPYPRFSSPVRRFESPSPIPSVFVFGEDVDIDSKSRLWSKGGNRASTFQYDQLNKALGDVSDVCNKLSIPFLLSKCVPKPTKSLSYPQLVKSRF